MKITVYKYDPATDAAPYYVSGEVEYRAMMTALEALAAFHEEIQAINFDFSCGCRLCGRCAMLVDGEPQLICSTPISDGNHIFEPLPGYPVIRDVTVDKSSLDARLSRHFDRVRIEPFTEETIVPQSYDISIKPDLYAMEFCCRCGVCDATCPAVAAHPNEYVGPAGMLAIAYRHLDPLDTGDRVMEAVNNGMYHCIMCGRCDQLCAQQDIEHIKAWQTLRDAAAQRGIVPSYAR